jgi:large subunit ribosomal protein L9
MKVYLKADISGVGMAGEIITVSDGYARNYLFPRDHAVEVTSDNEKLYTTRIKTVAHRKEVIATQTSMMAERIGSTQVTLKRKMHHDGKLYGSVGAADIADALKEHGFTVSKSQVIIDKSIKEKGAHTVTVKLTSRLQPKLKVVVAPE